MAGRKAQAIIRSCMLRRKKDSKLDGKELVTLPEKTIELRMLEFNKEERDICTSARGARFDYGTLTSHSPRRQFCRGQESSRLQQVRLVLAPARRLLSSLTTHSCRRYLRQNTVLKNYAHVLVMLLRLRQSESCGTASSPSTADRLRSLRSLLPPLAHR